MSNTFDFDQQPTSKSKSNKSGCLAGCAVVGLLLLVSGVFGVVALIASKPTTQKADTADVVGTVWAVAPDGSWVMVRTGDSPASAVAAHCFFNDKSAAKLNKGDRVKIKGKKGGTNLVDGVYWTGYTECSLAK